jgi:chemotaxis protein methyltransferase CheR
LEDLTTKKEPFEGFLEKVAFQKMKQLLQENLGLNCDGYRDEYLRRRLEIRLKATGSLTFGKYVIYLKKTPEEYQRLLNDLTINYTMFLRDADVFLYIEKNLMPKLFASNNIRMWSAGCATGEEPYSLAILAHKVLGDTATTHQLTIYASDIDKDALAKASKGEYQKKQLQGLSESTIEKYFTKEGEVYRVNDIIRRFIHFEQRDLMKEALHKGFDLVLCRNVMIYFSKESQQLIHMNFYNALRDGGYFITGKAEMLSGEPSKKFLPVDIKTRVYRKPAREQVLGQVGII